MHVLRFAAAAATSSVVLGATGGAVGAQTASFNCGNFPYQEDAQEMFDLIPGDPYGLDGPAGAAYTGVEGVACEELPRRSGAPATAVTVPSNTVSTAVAVPQEPSGYSVPNTLGQARSGIPSGPVVIPPEAVAAAAAEEAAAARAASAAGSGSGSSSRTATTVTRAALPKTGAADRSPDLALVGGLVLAEGAILLALGARRRGRFPGRSGSGA